jgi:hypothetical protein
MTFWKALDQALRVLIGFDQHVNRKPKAHLFGVHQGYPPFENALGSRR